MRTPHGRRAIRGEPAHWSLPEIDAFFAVVRDPRDRALFRVAYHRGLRASEIGQLDLADYDAGAGKLTVRRLKGSMVTVQRLAAVEERALRAWIRERGTAAGPLFPSRQRGRITRTRLDQLVKRYCAAAGMDRAKAHMHALKHSCGTHLRRMGEDLYQVQEHLGHKSAQNTRRYLHAESEQSDAAGARLRDWGKRK